jgi:hypothetical protein
MFHYYTAFLLSLFFTYSISNDIYKHHSNRSIVSSRSIYELVQIRRAAARLAAYHNRTHQNNIAKTNELYQIDYNPSDKYNDNKHISINEKTGSKNTRNGYLDERFKLIISISIIVVGFVILIVVICVVMRYIQHKHPISSRTSGQSQPLNTSRYISATRYYEQRYDTRNFTRKTRTVPAAV